MDIHGNLDRQASPLLAIASPLLATNLLQTNDAEPFQPATSFGSIVAKSTSTFSPPHRHRSQ